MRSSTISAYLILHFQCNFQVITIRIIGKKKIIKKLFSHDSVNLIAYSNLPVNTSSV